MPIVYGTDFSELSLAGARGAAALAARLGRELWLVHVLDGSTGADATEAGEAKTAAARVEERLAAEAERLAQAYPGLRVQHALLGGSAQTALVKFAEERAASLLVVSSQGHGASPLYRLGGTSERVAVASERPVMVLRAPEAFEQWARSERPLRILLGVDPGPVCDAAIQWVRQLRQAGPCDVVAAHVYYVPDARRRYGLRGLVSWIDPDPELERLLVRDLAARIGELPGTGEVVFRAQLGVGRLADHLLDLAERERVDLVVVGSRRRTGLARLSSVSGGALHFGRMAVACIPTRAGAAAGEAVPTIRTVLVPTDLSLLAAHGLRYGYALARPSGGEVFLLHVADPSASGGPNDAEIAARMRRLVPSEATTEGIATRTEIVRDRDVPAAICAAAERLGVDAICIASHGRTGFARAVLGSVAESVIRQSRRPVMVVRAPAEE